MYEVLFWYSEDNIIVPSEEIQEEILKICADQPQLQQSVAAYLS
jgi:hypothetical protein